MNSQASLPRPTDQQPFVDPEQNHSPSRRRHALRQQQSDEPATSNTTALPPQPQQHHHAAPVVTNALDETPLFRAAWLGQRDTVQYLLRTGAADPNHVDRYGCTPLHYTGCCATVQALLHAGADPSLSDRYGNTPLHVAAFAGHVDVAQLLLQSSSSSSSSGHSTCSSSSMPPASRLLYARNVHGETPFDRCRVLQQTSMAKFLLQQYVQDVVLRPVTTPRRRTQQRNDNDRNPICAILQEAVYLSTNDDDGGGGGSKEKQQQQPRVQLRMGTISVEQLLDIFILILRQDPTAIFGSFQAAHQWGAPTQVLYFMLRQHPETLLLML